MKSIQQELYFSWFLKRAITKIEFFVTSTKRSPSNFLNKTKLQIKIKTDFFLTGSDPART
jgi:hypothetical protein